MSLGQILRERRKEMRLTLDEVAHKVKFSKPYLSTIETGRVNNPPSDTLLKRLETVLNFEKGQLLWLGHLEGMPSDIREQFESAASENMKLRNLVKDVMSRKTPVTKLNKVLKKGKIKIDQAGPDISAGRPIPIINKVQAGYPADFDDMDYPVGIADDYVRCPDMHDPNAFAVRVIGDSMEPKFSQGNIVIFSPAADVANGDDCFIRFATPHETTFKRVFFEKKKQIRLQPRNEKYSPTTVDAKRINGIYRAMIRYERL